MAAGPACRRFRADITEIGFPGPFFTPRRKYPDGRERGRHPAAPLRARDPQGRGTGTRLCLLPRVSCRASHQDPGRQPVGQWPRLSRPRPAPHRQDDRPGTRHDPRAGWRIHFRPGRLEQGWRGAGRAWHSTRALALELAASGRGPARLRSAPRRLVAVAERRRGPFSDRCLGRTQRRGPAHVSSHCIHGHDDLLNQQSATSSSRPQVVVRARPWRPAVAPTARRARTPSAMRPWISRPARRQPVDHADTKQTQAAQEPYRQSFSLLKQNIRTKSERRSAIRSGPRAGPQTLTDGLRNRSSATPKPVTLSGTTSFDLGRCVAADGFEPSWAKPTVLQPVPPDRGTWR
jgi:hypothetical protein